jgi:hypothetical protein
MIGHGNQCTLQSTFVFPCHMLDDVWLLHCSETADVESTQVAE